MDVWLAFGRLKVCARGDLWGREDCTKVLIVLSFRDV